MTTADYLLLAIETGLLSLATYGIVGQVFKPGLRLLSPAGKLPARRYELSRWLTRLAALLVGFGLGLIPLWPDWLPYWWGPVLGLVGGSLCIPMHSAVKAALPGAVSRVLTGGSVTGNIETIDEPLPPTDISGYDDGGE